MKLAIMQPYFLPYIGYFQLISAADVFVLYDNIKYTKKGWINRNRLLRDGKDAIFSLPLKSDSDFLEIRGRQLASDFSRSRFLNQFREAYRRAPYFRSTFSLLEEVAHQKEINLFHFLHHSLLRICTHLGILSSIRISSEIEIDHALKSQDKVLALCSKLGAKSYINTIGGQALYAADAFKKNGVDLYFIDSQLMEYPQFSAPFVPGLSIIDVLMFNSPKSIRSHLLPRWTLLRPNQHHVLLA